MKIQVFDGFKTYAFTGESGGAIEGAKQEAYVEVPGARFPVRCDVSLKKGEHPLRPGVYVLGPGCYTVEEGRRVIVKPKAAELTPFEAKPRAAAAG